MLRRWLISGLLVLAPLAITLWVLDLVIGTMDKTLLLLPAEWQPDHWMGFHLPGLGVVVTLIVVLLVGATASNYVGARLVRWWDSLLNRIPVVRSIYSGVKQVSDTLFSSQGNAFREVVLIQYPHAGLRTIALVTGKPGGEVARHLNDEEYLSVYVPTTPNPTSGFFLMVPRADAIPLDMSVDEALKSIISMGVVVPQSHAAKVRVAPPARSVAHTSD